MPIYMDRHDVSAEVTAEHVAHLHQQDLNVQDKHHCKALTYWFDDDRKTAFCLVEAPNKEAMIAMHDEAHGKIPSEIIEVEKSIVESFLGRIEDPVKAINNELNIINDPAFRVVLEIKFAGIHKIASLKKFFLGHKIDFESNISKFKGRIVHIDAEDLLISFTDVSSAMECATTLKNNFENDKVVTMAICAGVPITEQNGFFEKVIAEANKMCVIESDKIIISSEVEALYESANLNRSVDANSFYVLQKGEMQFLSELMAITNAKFGNDAFTSNDFYVELHLSKSQFYRKITRLFGKSPNQFLKEYRLQQSISLLRSTEKNVSEIAFLVGFKSQSHYSKSFQHLFAISPTAFKASLREN